MKNTIIVKMAVVGFLALVLLIPAAMVSELIRERENTRNAAIDEASSKWSKDQSIVGPLLVVPYRIIDKVEGKAVESISYAYFVPEKLDISGDVTPEILKRGIYKIAAYKSDISFAGRFKQPNFNDLNIKPENVLWDKAEIFVGISDARGIKEDIELAWNGKKHRFFSGATNIRLSGSDIVRNNPEFDIKSETAATGIFSGVLSQAPLSAAGNPNGYDYSFKLKLNGSKAMYFSPVASETKVAMKSSWPTPGFDGSFLPDERTVNEQGFEAKWKVLELNRNIPQSWVDKNGASDIDGFLFGTKFLIGVDEYQKNMRVIKYAILTIALTFLIFFFVEIMNKIRIHPIQYVLVGLALILFYSLLLSFSEFISFNLAYLSASILTIAAVTLYSSTIFRNKTLSFVQGGILVVIYGFVFSILQLQDYALLAGNAGLFVILAIVMYLSRKVDWYELAQKRPE